MDRDRVRRPPAWIMNGEKGGAGCLADTVKIISGDTCMLMETVAALEVQILAVPCDIVMNLHSLSCSPMFSCAVYVYASRSWARFLLHVACLCIENSNPANGSITG